jgi:hypothetical protein
LADAVLTLVGKYLVIMGILPTMGASRMRTSVSAGRRRGDGNSPSVASGPDPAVLMEQLVLPHEPPLRRCVEHRRWWPEFCAAQMMP